MTARTLCDRGIALAAQGRAQAGIAARPRLILAATILASSLDFVGGSVVNVGLPAIGRSLHGQADALQWVVNGYLLPLSALLLLGGALGDRYGKRRLPVIGIAVFAAGSAGCAIAPSLGWLIAARAVQGLAAAMMLPNSLALLGASFEGRARSRAVGFWASSTAIAAAIGPVLGGWLIDTVGWRAIFLINLPLAAGAAALALWAIPPGPRAAKGGRLDFAGAALITVALMGIVWGLTEAAGKRGWTPLAIGAFNVGCLFLTGFVRTELRLGDAALMPPALFGARSIVALNLMTLLLYGVVGGYVLLLPYLLITHLGYSATAAGAALLPFSLITTVLAPIMGDLAGRIGARWPLIVGASLVAVSCLLALLAPRGGSYWTGVLPSVVALALGMACAAAPLTNAILSAVDPRHTGAASGLNSAVAQLGGVIAIALIGGVLASRGPAFAAAFDTAAVAGALTALAAAAAIAFLFAAPRGTSAAKA